MNSHEIPPTPHGDDPAAPTEARPVLGFVQLMLDPRGIQVLMLAGGGLLALGLVLWLAVIGVFDQPINMAVGLGLANFALLGAGVALATRTRHQVSGRAVAMLACLLMPLNLWFYDAQGLITLANGGSLWAAALVCCVVYAGVARLLRDSLFVYAFVAGVAMTGLLFLADGDIGHFWEVLAPSTLLVALGVACLHAERLFPAATEGADDQVFTRDDFGRAFFRAGHALLASGLGVLLAGRVAGRFYESLFANLEWFDRPDVATVTHVKLAALGIALTGAYAYVYSRLTNRTDARYTVCALLSLVWAGLIGIDLLGVEFTETLLVGLLALAAIGCRLAKGLFPAPAEESDANDANQALDALDRPLAYGTLALALAQLTRGVWLGGAGPLGFDFTWGYVVATSLVLVNEVLAARERPGVTPPRRFGALGLACVALAGGGLSMLPAATFAEPAALLLVMALTPAAWCVLAFVGKPWPRGAALRAAEAGAVVISLLLLPYGLFEHTPTTIGATFSLAGVLAAVAAGSPRRRAGAAAAVLAAFALWQAVVVYQIGAELPLLVVSAVSVAAASADRSGKLSRIGFAGRVGVCLAATAGCLLAGNRLLAGEADWRLLGMMGGQAVLTGLAVALSRERDIRRAFIGMGVLQVVVAGLVLNDISLLTFGQRLEVFSTVVGAGLVLAGLVGWRREATGNDVDEPLTDLNLWIGSVLAVVPLTVGLVATRLYGGDVVWVALHETGVLAIGLALAGVGLLCRLRATTLVGAGSLAVYLLGLVTLIHVPEQLQSVAVYLMVGGGTLFGGAVLLSVYRDRLLAIPEKFRDGEGVFAVLRWR